MGNDEQEVDESADFKKLINDLVEDKNLTKLQAIYADLVGKPGEREKITLVKEGINAILRSNMTGMNKK